MLFFDDNEASRPTREGGDGTLISDDADEEKALRLPEAPVLSWPQAAWVQLGAGIPSAGLNYGTAS